MKSIQDLLLVGLTESFPSFLTEEDWQHVVQVLHLSPQQARIVSLILQKKQDKEIGAELGLNRSTIRTYLRRVFDRVAVADRMELILHVFALCLRRREGGMTAHMKDIHEGGLFAGRLERSGAGRVRQTGKGVATSASREDSSIQRRTRK